MSKNINNKEIKYLHNGRIDFSKISGTLPLPNLVEIQTKSFAWLEEHGIDEVFKDIYPIKSPNEQLIIEYVSCRLDKPQYDFLECKIRGLTFSAPLKVTFRLINTVTGEIKESEVFMGDFPLMTNSGTFIINGAERAIVSQIVRSPGAYFSSVFDNKSGKYSYNADLIPARGTWLQFEADLKDQLWVRIERLRKMSITVLLRALGFSTYDKMIELFGDNEALINTINKEREGKENEVGKIAQSILIVTGITCLFFTLFAPEFIYLLGGNAYQSAIWVVPPVCMSVYFIMMYSLISTVTFYYEKTKSIMLASCAIAVLNIILNQYFITIYGMVAAGYTTLVCYICYALVHYLLMCHVSKDKKKQNPFNIGIIWIPAVLFVFLAVVSSLSYTHLKLRILLMVLLGGLLIFVAYKNKSNLLKLMKK